MNNRVSSEASAGSVESMSRLSRFGFSVVSSLGLLGCVTMAVSSPEPELNPADHQEWRLPDVAPYPEDNKPSDERILLGKTLFFDPRLSGKSNISCATCHNPSMGWSDGLKTAVGFDGKILGRATPTVVNSGFNILQMWDGRHPTLEKQATGPVFDKNEMNLSREDLEQFLSSKSGYVRLFEEAYPGEGINATTFSKALANYQRSLVANKSPFDQWLAGDSGALTNEELLGFSVFIDSSKGNCAVCHAPPNFTDSGFHNLGLVDTDAPKSDVGRFKQKPLHSMRGAFKTPGLRDVARTAPYFHNGAAGTLRDVVDHYARQDLAWGKIAPNMKQIQLSEREKEALVAFMKALTSPYDPPRLPELP